MTYDRSVIDNEEIPSSLLFNNDMLRWQSQQNIDYHHNTPSTSTTTTTTTTTNDLVPLQAVIHSSNNDNNDNTNTNITSSSTITLAPAINTTNPAVAPPPPLLDPKKIYHPEWGIIKDGDFHALTLKHQRDLENHFQTDNPISDFYFWQANMGGYCMADMIQGIIISSDGAYVLERKMVEGAPHPGRRKKKKRKVENKKEQQQQHK